MEKSTISYREKIAKIENILKDLDINITNNSLIQDNKSIFHIDSKIYRCRMPNQRERSEAEQKKNEFYIQLIQNENIVTRKKLKEILKEKQDIDIDALEKKKLEILDKLKRAYEELYPYYSDEEKEIDAQKEKIEEIEKEYKSLSSEIIIYLEPCIESQIDKYYIEYLTYLCTDKLLAKGDKEIDDQWNIYWKSFNDFQIDDTNILDQAIKNLSNLVINIES